MIDDLTETRNDLIAEAAKLLETAKRENRDVSEEEIRKYKEIKAKIAVIDTKIQTQKEWSKTTMNSENMKTQHFLIAIGKAIIVLCIIATLIIVVFASSIMSEKEIKDPVVIAIIAAFTIIFFSTAIFNGLLIQGFGELIDHTKRAADTTERLLDKMDDLTKELANIKRNEAPKSASTEDNRRYATFSMISNDVITCNSCGYKQRAGGKVCIQCGAFFKNQNS